MTGTGTYTYEIGYDPGLGVVTRARGEQKSVQEFLSVDPLASEFAIWTPYHYVHNNPILLIDPDGRSASSPIFGTDGQLLGTDSEGWTGEAIVMDEANFTQGMDHSQALESGTELGSYTEGIRISQNDWNTVSENGGSVMAPSVINNSDETIFFKPETTQHGLKNGEAYPIAANTDLYVPVDGVAAPHIRENEVFKSVTGVQVEVSNTTVTTNANGTKQSVGQFIKGGWKNEAWNKSLNTPVLAQTYPPCCGGTRAGYSPGRPGDTSWNALFEKSKQP